MAALCLPATGRADWRHDIGTFRIGIVAEPGAGNTVAGLSRLTEAFSNALGMKVEFFVAQDFATLIEAQERGSVEYAVYSALAYVTAQRRCGCVEPLVAPLDSSGAAGIRAVLIGRDETVSTLDAIESHRIALPPDGLGVIQLGMIGLHAQGVILDPDSALVVHAASAAEAEGMLADGSVDAMIGWAPTGEGVGEAGNGGTVARLTAAGLEPSRLHVLWQSPMLRYGPHAVRRDLDPEAKRRLAVFLTNLKTQTPDVYDLLESRHSGGLVAASSSDYDTAGDIVDAIAGGAR